MNGSSDLSPWTREWTEIEEISRGGQGIITSLRSISEPTKRAVLKRIVPRWKDDPQARARLLHEVEVLEKLHGLGARVPRVLDSCLKHDSAEPFFVMEFISGLRFDEWLKTKAPVNTQKAVIITRAIAETIGLCHEHRIGHRDIKPSNIILKDSDISSPYMIDFGISFDSRQTIILTREGEMFWNEFIILPECQDLEGGHRDLRSDITALVGLFFSCLTGRPPIVLRDATDQAPHQRHKSLVDKAAGSSQEGERLMWFFQRGFAFRISERFQKMSDFVSELMKFADSPADSNLDPIEQFRILSHKIEATDRTTQLQALRSKYGAFWPQINRTLAEKLKPIQMSKGTFEMGTFVWTNRLKAQLPPGDIVDINYIKSFTISRRPAQGSAIALVIGMAVDMEIQLYASAYTDPLPPDKLIEWTKIATVEGVEKEMSSRTVNVIVDALANMLAHQIRNLILLREQSPVH